MGYDLSVAVCVAAIALPNWVSFVPNNQGLVPNSRSPKILRLYLVQLRDVLIGVTCYTNPSFHGGVTSVMFEEIGLSR